MRAMFRPGTMGEVFNLGNPEEHTVLEFAQTIIQLCDSTSSIGFESSRIDDPERRRPNITKAHNLLEWEIKVSMEDGLRRTIDWFRSRTTHFSTVSY
jgi:nucleoside-diphosphate-sugar epimerase